MDSAPLFGKRILITRPKEQSASFVRLIEQCGGTPLVVPLLKIRHVRNKEKVKETLRHVHEYQWLVFTSQNGVSIFFDLLKDPSVNKKIKSTAKIAVVGDKTEKVLKEHGYSSVLKPSVFTGEALLEELLKVVPKEEKILFVRGNLAKDTIPKGLKEQGLEVETMTVYETVADKDKQKELDFLVKEEQMDAITFMSPSAVNAFCELVPYSQKENGRNLPLVCVGDVTGKRAEACGFSERHIAHRASVDGMMKVLIHYFSKRRSD